MIFMITGTLGILLFEIGLTPVHNMFSKEKVQYLYPEVLMLSSSVSVYFACKKLAGQGRKLSSQSKRRYIFFCKYNYNVLKP